MSHIFFFVSRDMGGLVLTCRCIVLNCHSCLKARRLQRRLGGIALLVLVGDNNVHCVEIFTP